MKFALIFLISCFITHSSFANLTVEGVTFPETHTLGEQELVLNGIGVRKATFLKVRVYVGALYLEKKSSTAEDFLGWESPKYITMHFLRNVKKSDLTGAWDEGFEAVLPADQLNALAPQRSQLNELMADLKKGETMNFTFTKDSVAVEVQGRPAATIQGSDFSRGLLSVWFINPRDKELTRGLLGL